MSKDIEAHFEITHEILFPIFLERFLQWLNDFDGGKWKPERYNNADPARHVYSATAIADIVAMWMKDNIGIILKRISTPKYEIDFTGQRNKLLVKNQLTVYLESELFQQSKSMQSCITFLNALYLRLRPVWGFSAQRKDYLAKNLQLTYPGGNVSRLETWVGKDLSKCLWGIYWANWFGPAYVDFFGRERLDSAPYFQKERLSDGGYLILTAASPLEYDTPAAQELEQALRGHLGFDAFYDIRTPQRPTRSPWGSKFVS